MLHVVECLLNGRYRVYNTKTDSYSVHSRDQLFKLVDIQGIEINGVDPFGIHLTKRLQDMKNLAIVGDYNTVLDCLTSKYMFHILASPRPESSTDYVQYFYSVFSTYIYRSTMNSYTVVMSDGTQLSMNKESVLRMINDISQGCSRIRVNVELLE